MVNEAIHYTPVYNIFTRMLQCFQASDTYEINYYKCIDNVHVLLCKFYLYVFLSLAGSLILMEHHMFSPTFQSLDLTEYVSVSVFTSAGKHTEEEIGEEEVGYTEG